MSENIFWHYLCSTLDSRAVPQTLRGFEYRLDSPFMNTPDAARAKTLTCRFTTTMTMCFHVYLMGGIRTNDVLAECVAVLWHVCAEVVGYFTGRIRTHYLSEWYSHGWVVFSCLSHGWDSNQWCPGRVFDAFVTCLCRGCWLFQGWDSNPLPFQVVFTPLSCALMPISVVGFEPIMSFPPSGNHVVELSYHKSITNVSNPLLPYKHVTNMSQTRHKHVTNPSQTKQIILSGIMCIINWVFTAGG